MSDLPVDITIVGDEANYTREEHADHHNVVHQLRNALKEFDPEDKADAADLTAAVDALTTALDGKVQTIDGNAPDEAGDVDLSGTYGPLPEGTPEVGQLGIVTDVDPLTLEWGNAGLEAPPVGPEQSYTFTVEDEADEDSWYGSAGVHILPTWTPTVSGSMVLLFGPDNGDSDYTNFDIYFWKGAVANVDYPDATADSGPFYVGPQTDVYATHRDQTAVTAGQPYTIILVDWAGGPEAVGHTIDLAGILNSLFSFGGLEDLPPPLPDGESFVAVVGPNGSVWRPCDPHTFGDEGYATRATGRGATAQGVNTHASGQATHAEGVGSYAGGYATHAEGVSCSAEGQATHAEGEQCLAEGSPTHAEGQLTHAEGAATHAEGIATHAEGTASHAEGISANAYRTGEHAEGSGRFADGKAAQVSSLTLGLATVDATPTAMVIGLSYAPLPNIPLRDDTLSNMRVRVAARKDDGSTASAWVVDAVMDKASGVARLIGTATPTVAAADVGASAWDVEVTTDGTDAIVTVTGAAATTIRWVASVKIVEVRFA